MPDLHRIELAVERLCQSIIPDDPEEDESAHNERLDEAFGYAISTIERTGDSPLSPDANHAHDLIKKKLIRENLGPEKASRFSNLYSRLLTAPVLKEKWAFLYFLYTLSESDKIKASRLAYGEASSAEPTTVGNPANGHDVLSNHSFEQDALAPQGLAKVPSPNHNRSLKQVRNEAATGRLPERPRPHQQLNGKDVGGAPELQEEQTTARPSETALLRDLPFMLQGLSSTTSTFSSPQTLQIPNALPIPIVSLLYTLAEPALLYKSLFDFAQRTDGGLLGQSLRAALDIELRAYLRLVAALEGQIRSAMKQLGDSGINTAVREASVTLKRCVVWTREPTLGLRLLALIVEKSKARKGGELISLIHSFSLTMGDPFVAAFAERLLVHVTKPFYDMLRQWVYGGELSDPYLEFLVVEQGQGHAGTDGLARGAATSVWQEKYHLRLDMIPTIITEDFARKVFLIGKTLNFIRHSCDDADWVETYSKSQICELRYGDTATLERSIDEAYKTTMARLVHLMTDKFKLVEHLQALKKYILLGAGDFIAILMESLSLYLDRPANTQYRHTFIAQLEHAVRNSNAQYDDAEVLRRLDARMLELSHGEIGWDVFTLEYKIDAPVDVIVTPYGSKQYLKVFNFLWRVKRVEFALGSTWRRCMTGARGVLASVDDKLSKDWKKARCEIAEMVHFVSQLQYYILFEVIESSWNDLQRALAKEDSTLDDLIEAHANYLTSITRKGLLGSTSVDFTAQLHELLKTMLAYKDAVDGLYSYSVAEFTRQQEFSARVESRTAAGKWGMTEKDAMPSKEMNDEAVAGSVAAVPGTAVPLLASGTGDASLLNGLRKRLTDLGGDFKARVNILLGDLLTQPDLDMRWLAMVMNFNDVYHPVRRKRKHDREGRERDRRGQTEPPTSSSSTTKGNARAADSSKLTPVSESRVEGPVKQSRAQEARAGKSGDKAG